MPTTNSRPAEPRLDWRFSIALVTMSRAGPGASSPRLSSSGSVAESPIRPEHRDQHDQRREDREDAVVGERRGPVGEVVVVELADGRFSTPRQDGVEMGDVAASSRRAGLPRHAGALHPCRPLARAAAARSRAARRGAPPPAACCARCRSARSAAPPACAGAICVSQPDAHHHVRGQRREARGDLPHVQVVHLHDVRRRRERAPDLLAGRGRAGQASSSTRPESRSSPTPERVINAATIRSAAMPSALREAGGEHHHAGDRGGDEREEVGEHVLEGALDVEAAAVGARQRRSSRRGSRRSRRSPPPSRSLPPRPAARSSRRTPSSTITAPSASSVAPFSCADRISARRMPKVKPPPAGRRARRAARIASAIAPASVSMWAASESRARESARMPTTTSTAMKPRISASAMRATFRRPESACHVRVEMVSAHHSDGRTRPGRFERWRERRSHAARARPPVRA